MNDADSGEVIYQSDAAERLFGWGEEGAGKTAAARGSFRRPRAISWKSAGNSCATASSKIARRCSRTRTAGNSGPHGNLRVVEFQGRRVVLAGIADVTKQKKRDGEVALAREMLANAIESLSEGFALV